MVPQIGPDTGKMVAAGHPGGGQRVGIADSGQLQKMRRVDHTAGENHLAAGPDRRLRPVPPPLAPGHARGPPPLKTDPRRLRAGDDAKIAAVFHRVKKGVRGAHTAAATG